jgi:TonB family protein
LNVVKVQLSLTEDKNMPLLHENQVTEITSIGGNDFEHKHRRHMLVALTLLLAALILVLTKDYSFWFPPAPQARSESEPMEELSPEPKMQSETATTVAQPAVAVRPKAKSYTPPAASAEANPAPASAAVVTSRAVLPPLQVEIVAGDERRTVQAGSNSVKVDLRPPFSPTEPSSTRPKSDAVSVADATAQVHLSPSAAEALSSPVEPNYPMLAKQMRIQGAVVLEALIGRDGSIQALHVLSGPAILSAAAQEAVKQWRFKPYLQSGQTVETKARIVVNFTIFT